MADTALSPAAGDDVDDSPTGSLQQLERGLAVIQAFSHENPALSISDASRITGVNRATVRRVLLTLEKLGHVRQEGRLFTLTPRVLNLGWAYLSSLNLWEVARPVMQDLVETVGETCTASTLDPPDIVYVARVLTRQHMVMNARIVGSRLPAAPTAHGRVLLAGLTPEELDEFLDQYPLTAYTERTVTDPARFREVITAIRESGWTISDQETEMGLRSAATAIRRSDGRTIAALGISGPTVRTSNEEMRERFVPLLVQTAGTISRSLSYNE
jgi:IclR family pca regulon transcriptional regulator